MTQNGKITTVAIMRAGSALQTAAAISDVVIYVDDAYDFIETGGSLEIDGVTYTYTAVDMDSDAITLTTGLTSAFDIGQPVFAMPSSYEKRASVTLSDGGDTTEARVPHNLYDRIPEGIREDFAQESVTLDIVNEEWTIVDVIGKEPSIDGSFLDPSTVPPTSTDGAPPAFSPVLTAIGSIGAVFLRWPAITNADPVLYAVHISTTDGFTADSTTLLSVTPGATLTVRTLPDNTPLSYGVTYYFRVIATDADGAAEASAVVSAQMMQVTGPDIAANYGYFGQIIADQITGGTLSADVTLSSTIKTAATGARAELSALGLLITDSTGAPTTILGTNGENYFKGNAEINGLTVTGGATFRSTTNELSRAAVWTLASGVTASTNAPSVVVDWEKTPLKDSTGATWPTPGNLRGLHLTLSGKWMSADTAGAVHQWNADGTHFSTISTTTGLTHAVQPVSGGAIYGMRVSGSTAYISRLTEETVFSDDFSGTLSNWPLNSTVGTGTITIDTARAKLNIPPTAEAILSRALEGNFKTRAVQFKLDLAALAPSASGCELSLNSTTDATSWFTMGLQGNELYWQVIENSTVTSQSDIIAFNPTAHAYWRIFEFKNVMTFQTSPDGVTWTTVGSGTHTRAATVFQAMRLDLWVYSNAQQRMTNSTFESNADNWFLATSGTELHRSNAQAHSGTWSMWIVPSVGNTGMLSVRSNAISVSPGDSYDVAAWAKSAVGGTDQAAIVAKWYDSFGAQIGSTTVVSLPINSSSWTQLSGVAVAPTGVSLLRFELQNSDASGSGAEVFWDDVTALSTATNVTLAAYADNFKYFKVIGSIPYTRINTAQSPALGIAFGGLLVAEYDAPNTRFSVRRVDAENMSTIISTLTTPSNAAFGGTLAGIMRGTFDYAEDRYILSAYGASGTNWWSFKTSDGSYQSTDNFPVITGGNQGIGWDGTNFWGLGSDGNLYKHTNIKWVSGTDSAAWSAGFTWYDGGTQESGVSPYAAFTMKMRARLTVTSSAIPYSGVGDPDRIRVYVGRGAGSKYRQATSAATVNTVTLTTATFSGTVAPTVSTFLSATPAKIRNSDDSLIISADGTITLGGKQVSVGIPTVTVLQTTGTWTKPAGLKSAMVEVIGSGGGGGGPTGAASSQSEGGHGAGGGYTKKFYLASDLSATEAYTVGAAGTAGVAGGAGGTGGTVTFKGLSATGGTGGAGMPAIGATSDGVAAGGAGGVGSGGDVNLPGENGSKARALQGKACLTGRGGSSGNGMGAGGSPPTVAGNGVAGTGYGGGGSGGFGAAAGANGGAGSKGAIIITCYF